jgi:hypothetical protein
VTIVHDRERALAALVGDWIRVFPITRHRDRLQPEPDASPAN